LLFASVSGKILRVESQEGLKLPGDERQDERVDDLRRISRRVETDNIPSFIAILRVPMVESQEGLKHVDVDRRRPLGRRRISRRVETL
jgi:hypothetical protein